MGEGLYSFLRRDLRENLAAAARPAEPAPGAGRWIMATTVLLTLVGLAVFELFGYHAGFVQMNQLTGRAPAWLWQLLTTLGNERVAFALALFFSRRHPRIFWALVVAGLIGAVYTLSLKPLFSTSRPPTVLEPGTFDIIGPALRKESFPSGHTVTAAVFFGIWVQYLRNAWIRGALIFAAIAVGVSRVAVGVHWPLDVVAGLAGGLLAARLGVWFSGRHPWGLSRAAVHLVFVGLAVLMVANLVFQTGEYPAATEARRLLGCAALAYAAFSYLIEPTRRWQRARKAPVPG